MVHEDVWAVRDLILTIRDEWAPGWDDSGLLWWIDQHPLLRDFLGDVGKPEARQPLPHADDTRIALYAISDARSSENNPADDDTDMTAGERVDLLRYRHSLRRDLGRERWPFDDRLVEARQVNRTGR